LGDLSSRPRMGLAECFLREGLDINLILNSIMINKLLVFNILSSSIIYFASTTFLTVLQIVLFLIVYLHCFRLITWLGLRISSFLGTICACCWSRPFQFFIILFPNYSNTKISYAIINLIIILCTYIYMGKSMLIKNRLQFLNIFKNYIGHNRRRTI
jgi:hypothetical protein